MALCQKINYFKFLTVYITVQVDFKMNPDGGNATEGSQKRDICCEEDFAPFQSSAIMCHIRYYCLISKNAKYFSYKNRVHICEDCFNRQKEDSISLEFDNMDMPEKILKSDFKEVINNRVIPEPFVECIECGNIQHAICVLYLEPMWPEGFTCDSCLKKKAMKREINIYTSQNLPITKLSSKLESRARSFLKFRGATSLVNIRVVSVSDKMYNLHDSVKELCKLGNNVLVDIPYRSKVILAFQLIDGIDVCFFGMIVQEHDSECPAPNTGKVNLSYIDSVKYFTPEKYRTDLYQEILLGYMQHVKKLGYTSIHIWAAPPRKNEFYIFNYRPENQKIPTEVRLKEWYKRLLNKAIDEGIVIKCERELHADINFLAEFPYFKGDFWQSMVDNTVNELVTEREEKNQNLAGGKTLESVADNNASVTTFKQMLLRKVVMTKHINIFFTAHLNQSQKEKKILDPDPVNATYFIEDHFSFMVSVNQLNLEFSSLRKAKYSTMILLYNMFQQYEDQYLSACNMCEEILVDSGYSCKVCKYFNLCVDCFKLKKHTHDMFNFETLPPDHQAWSPDKYDIKSYLLHFDWFKLHIQMIYHTFGCDKGANCKFAWCATIRLALNCKCQRKGEGGCSVCSSFMYLCNCHAKNCTQVYCNMPHCLELKIPKRTERKVNLINQYNRLFKRKYL